jgi:capsular polysaccharide export protein
MIPTTRTIAELPHLHTFTAEYPKAVVGWGRKASGQRAMLLARVLRRDVLFLEDGFIRSVERTAPRLSLLVDDVGVYYDARRPSAMERLIARGIDGNQTRRSSTLMGGWQSGCISKYNHSPEYDGPLDDRYVLVADQTFGDLAIAGGMADPACFVRMLDAALTENPHHEILVKVHPDVVSGRKLGNLPPAVLGHPRVRVIGTDCHPSRLLRYADAVYVVTSLIGFEAMIWAKPVRCFGMPFYAGWGVTSDELPPPKRRGRASVEDVVHAALVGLARYADPASGAAWSAEQTMAYVAERRALHSDSLARHASSYQL